MFRPGTEGEGAEGETGELAARGPYTIRGYLDAPDRDREAFTAEGFYRSGDLVRTRRYQGALSYSIEAASRTSSTVVLLSGDTTGMGLTRRVP